MRFLFLLVLFLGSAVDIYSQTLEPLDELTNLENNLISLESQRQALQLKIQASQSLIQSLQVNSQNSEILISQQKKTLLDLETQLRTASELSASLNSTFQKLKTSSTIKTGFIIGLTALAAFEFIYIRVSAK